MKATKQLYNKYNLLWDPALAAALMAEQNVLLWNILKLLWKLSKLGFLLWLKLRKRISNYKKDPKNKLTTAIHPVKEKICFICQKSPQTELSICATCEKLDILFVPLVTAMKIIFKMTKKVFSDVSESILTQLLIQFFSNLVWKH